MTSDRNSLMPVHEPALRRDPAGELRLFENPVLERLTRVRPGTVAAIWAPVIGVTFYLGVSAGALGIVGVLAAAAAGLIGWSLLEYVFHRFLFHFPARSAAMRRVLFLLHENHHVDPADPTRNVLPPITSIPAGILLFGLSHLLFPAAFANVFFAFLALGYLAYDLVHYAAHQRQPKGRIGLALKRHHLRHHYARDAGNYGVSSPLWDYIFGTRLSTRRDRQSGRSR